MISQMFVFNEWSEHFENVQKMMEMTGMLRTVNVWSLSITSIESTFDILIVRMITVKKTSSTVHLTPD